MPPEPIDASDTFGRGVIEPLVSQDTVVEAPAGEAPATVRG